MPKALLFTVPRVMKLPGLKSGEAEWRAALSI
jgi:hypothetical protein